MVELDTDAIFVLLIHRYGPKGFDEAKLDHVSPNSGITDKFGAEIADSDSAFY
jgi:hypothetical protein